MKWTIGPERVIMRGIRPEDGLWGPDQFPTAYRCGEKIVVSVHRGADNIQHYGDSRSWFESADGGDTWTPADPSIAGECGLPLPNGERISFPRVSATDLSEYEIPEPKFMTPGTDFSAKAASHTLPLQDGITFQMGGVAIRAYRSERLPAPLDEKKWKLLRKYPNGEVREEYAELVWPNLTRVVFSDSRYQNPHMKGLFPTGVPKIGPDGAIWITAYSGEGHIAPNGQYTPYYSAELFRSTDNGHTFVQTAHMEYPADGADYPYQSGGFSDSEIAFFDDGRMAWFMRSAWFGSTGLEWAPMYRSISDDGGKTWSKPTPFSFTGVYPSLCRLECGVTLLCFARPGMFVTACRNDDCTEWESPIELMTPDNRAHLANLPQDPPRFHDWDGACNNASLIALDRNSALIFNCDFYMPDASGVKRKTVFCRKITVDPTDSE